MGLPSITWTDVTARYPAVASASTATQTAILEDVDREVSAPEWGDDVKRAKAALAAHLALMSARGGAIGPVSSEAVGPVSVSYAVMATLTALESTGPGAEFLRIRQSIVAFRFPTTIWCW